MKLVKSTWANWSRKIVQSVMVNERRFYIFKRNLIRQK
ncbi:unnamed protein product [Paramecium octaurelia]|uniref:Uncharacterized protein n=1 Tax=Paramecium octaurelia TaxID=43137 RepID=A0A8S1XXV1_PAROT|nr:unnamed protein product [Paramecium octaurelia]